MLEYNTFRQIAEAESTLTKEIAWISTVSLDTELLHSAVE